MKRPTRYNVRTNRTQIRNAVQMGGGQIPWASIATTLLPSAIRLGEKGVEGLAKKIFHRGKGADGSTDYSVQSSQLPLRNTHHSNIGFKKVKMGSGAYKYVKS